MNFGDLFNDFSLISLIALLIIFSGSLIVYFIKYTTLSKKFGRETFYLAAMIETNTKFLDKMAFYFFFGVSSLSVLDFFIPLGKYSNYSTFLFIYMTVCTLAGIFLGLISPTSTYITQKITYGAGNDQRSVERVVIYDETDDFIYYLMEGKPGTKWNAIKKDKIISIESLEE